MTDLAKIVTAGDLIRTVHIPIVAIAPATTPVAPAPQPVSQPSPAAPAAGTVAQGSGS